MCNILLTVVDYMKTFQFRPLVDANVVFVSVTMCDYMLHYVAIE